MHFVLDKDERRLHIYSNKTGWSVDVSVVTDANGKPKTLKHDDLGIELNGFNGGDASPAQVREMIEVLTKALEMTR